MSPSIAVAQPVTSPHQPSTLHLVAPALRPVAASLQVFDPERESLATFRANMRAIYAQMAPPLPEARTEHWLPTNPSLRVLVYRPSTARPDAPAILYIHGGGFIAGDAEIDDATCVRMAETHGAVVVNVDYRLAPETPFPGPVEDCYAALAWLLEQAPALGVDRQRVVVMGPSAGGGLAAATALLHRDRGGLPLAGQVLIYPMLDCRTGTSEAPFDNPSVGEFAWNRKVNRFAWQAMRGDSFISYEREGHFSPSLAADVSGLPPTFVAVGSLDLFLEEDVDYALRLSRAGVPVGLEVYEGGIHGFDLLPGTLATTLHDDVNRALSRFLA